MMENNNVVAVLIIDDFDPIINRYLERFPEPDDRVDLDEGGNPRLIIVNDNSIPFVNAPAGVAYGEPGGECLDVHGYVVHMVAENQLREFNYRLVFENRMTQDTYAGDSDQAKRNRKELGFPKGIVIEQLWKQRRRKTSDILLVGIDTDNYKPIPTFKRVREIISYYMEQGIKNFVINMSFVIMPLRPYLEIPEYLRYMIDRRPLLQKEVNPYKSQIRQTLDSYRWYEAFNQVNEDFNEIAKRRINPPADQVEDWRGDSITLGPNLLGEEHWLNQCRRQDLPIFEGRISFETVQKVFDLMAAEPTPFQLESVVNARYQLRNSEPKIARKLIGSLTYARFHSRRDLDYEESINNLGDLFKENVLNHLKNQGLKIIGVSAAGNRRRENYQNPFAPARWPSVVAVSADKENNHDFRVDVADYSQNGDIKLSGTTNYNQSVTLNVEQSTKILNYRSSECRGTSYAAPRYSVIAGRFLAIGGETDNEKPDFAGGNDWKNDLPKDAVESLGEVNEPNGPQEEVMGQDNKAKWAEAFKKEDE